MEAQSEQKTPACRGGADSGRRTCSYLLGSTGKSALLELNRHALTLIQLENCLSGCAARASTCTAVRSDSTRPQSTCTAIGLPPSSTTRDEQHSVVEQIASPRPLEAPSPELLSVESPSLPRDLEQKYSAAGWSALIVPTPGDPSVTTFEQVSSAVLAERRRAGYPGCLKLCFLCVERCRAPRSDRTARTAKSCAPSRAPHQSAAHCRHTRPPPRRPPSRPGSAVCP